MRTRVASLSRQFVQFVLVLYFAAAGLVFIPYYNWQYARDRGFASWLLFGEVVPTAKALVWPYFVFLAPHDDQRETLAQPSQQRVDRAMANLRQAWWQRDYGRLVASVRRPGA